MLRVSDFSPEFVQRFNKIIETERKTIEFPDTMFYDKGSRFYDNRYAFYKAVNETLSINKERLLVNARGEEHDRIAAVFAVEISEFTDNELRAMAKLGLLDAASADQYYDEKCRMECYDESENDNEEGW